VILFDTTVLVYAVGAADHPLRSTCRRVVELVRDGTVRGTATVEVIQEFVHVRSRRHSRADAVSLARGYATGLGPLVRPEIDDLMEGLDLFRRSTALGCFDAILAVTARRRGWALASADAAFAKVRGLRHLDPTSPAFLDRARAVG